MTEPGRAGPTRTWLKDRYALGDPLGHGSLGTTYRALDVTMRRPVAVKLCSERYADDALFGQRFMAATAAAARLEHPRVAAVLDAGLAGGRPFAVLELVNGKSLRALLSDEGRLPIDRCARIALQVADALGYAHGQRVVHGDLRPENVLIDTQGNVKVTDFGFIRAAVATDLTLLGNARQRAPYVPPEQLLSDPKDERGDVYALGVLLYEMLTGQTPVSELDALRSAGQRQPPTPPHRLRPDVPAHVDRAVMGALAADPRGRFSSVQVFQLALAGQSSVVRAQTPAPPVQPPGGDAPDRQPAPIAASPTAGAGPATAPLARPPTHQDSGVDAQRAAPLAWHPEVHRRPRRGSRGLGHHAAALVPILASVAILLMGAVGLTAVIPNLFSGLQMAEVPPLAEHDLAEATSIATAHGLEVKVTSTPVTEDRPKGVVLAQNPAPGGRLRRGSEVKLTVSAGLRPPNVLNKPLDEARATLIRSGWSVAAVETRSDTNAPSGTVVGSRPGPDEAAEDKRQGMTLLVSAGNLAYRRPIKLSSGAAGAGEMVDGDPNTLGKLGGPAPSWVELELAQPSSVAGVELVIAQDQPGVSIHEVWIWTTENQFRGMHTFVGPTSDNQTLSTRFDQPVASVRAVRIATTQADGLPGWREIRIINQ